MIESPWLLAGYSRDKTALTRSSELVCSNRMGDGWHIIRPHLSLSGDQGSSGSLGLPRGSENTGSLGLPKGHGGLGFLAYLKGLEVRSLSLIIITIKKILILILLVIMIIRTVTITAIIIILRIKIIMKNRFYLAYLVNRNNTFNLIND